VNLKPFNREYLPGVLDFAINHGVFKEAHGCSVFDRQYVQQLWEDFFLVDVGGGQTLWDGDELVGVIAWVESPQLYTASPCLDIQFWCVSPAHRDKSGGGRLIQAAMEYAKPRSLPIMISCGTATPLNVTWSLAQMGFKPSTIDYEWSPFHGQKNKKGF